MGILVRNNKVISAGGKILYNRTGNPFDLPNLKLYLSATRMVQQSDGSSVPSFVDFSGNNFHATQASVSLQPTFQTNEFGVNAGIKGDGVNDAMFGSVDLFKNINQYTIQLLYKRTVLGIDLLFLARTAGGSNRAYVRLTTTQIEFYTQQIDGTTQLAIVYPNTDLLPHLIQYTLNPANNIVYFYLDGVLSGTLVVPAGYMNNSNHLPYELFAYTAGASYGKNIINGLSVSHSYSDPATIQAQYRGYLQRGYL